MSNTKKSWNASKATKRANIASKKAVKINTATMKQQQRKAAKLNYK